MPQGKSALCPIPNPPLIGLVRPPAAANKLWVWGCWRLQPHWSHCGEGSRRCSASRKGLTSACYHSERFAPELSCRPVSTLPGRWAVRWWWTPTPFAGRPSAWLGNRPSCARLSRRSSERWLKGPGWAWGSANTSLGTADGTARATTSISEKYCNKVSDDRVEWLYWVIPLCCFLYFSTAW